MIYFYSMSNTMHLITRIAMGTFGVLFIVVPSASAYTIDTEAVPSQRTRREQVQTERQEKIHQKNRQNIVNEKSESDDDALTGALLDVVYEDSDFYTFGAQITIENVDTENRVFYTTKQGGTPPMIVPGRYSAYTEASSKGFPQEAKYQIIDTTSGDIIEEFPRTHVPVNNILIEKGQKLRIIVLPATRPYNSVFFRIGKQRSAVGIILNRPYPIFDFEPGDFRGAEQFSSAQIAIAFWGMKESEQDPVLAAAIRKDGIDGIRAGSGGRFRDPILVLGVRTIARDLAKTFVEQRNENQESYRGKYHVTFQVQRTAGGKVPRELLTMNEKQLAEVFEKQILWIEYHNVHRANEGGGYAGMTFLEVLDEAKEKVMLWPRNSFESTEIAYNNVTALEIAAATVGMDTYATFPNGQSGVVRRLLKNEIRTLVKAIRRERMNYGTYETAWIEKSMGSMNFSLTDRLRTINHRETLMLNRLQVLDPKDAEIY